MKTGVCSRGVLVLMAGLFTIGVRGQTAVSDYPIQPVPFTRVRLNDRFWQPRLLTNVKVSIPSAFRQCEETGRILNFEIAAGRKQGAFATRFPFDDSDVYKIIEAAAYALQVAPDSRLEKYVDGIIEKIAAAQEPDGYLMTWRRIDPGKPPTSWSGNEKRWSDIKGGHELYNMGHLYEAAVAYYEATGKKVLLNVALKNADLIDRTFGPGKNLAVPGHEEIELGLFKLFRATKNARYLQLAKFFIDERGNASGHKLYGEYAQDHRPVLAQTEAVGHAVRAGYLYSAVADLVALTGHQGYARSLERIWDDVVNRKIYLTGGIGARHEGESFGADYELPNLTAYNETCAAIANVFWNHRMFLLQGESRYIDVLEQTLYNGVLAGIGLEGDTFFYPNPLESDGVYKFNQGQCTRQPWFDCSCCPSNATRFVASIPGYVYASRGHDLYLNLYIQGDARIDLAGEGVELHQTTDYPWDGRVRVSVEPSRERTFAILLRVPGWVAEGPLPGDLYAFTDTGKERPEIRVNGQACDVTLSKGYLRVERTWKAGDTLELELPMPIRRVRSHRLVTGNAGRIALQRGPIVYCAEGVDHGGSLKQLAIPPDAPLAVSRQDGLLGGVTTIELNQPGDQPCRFVPYYAWSHRGVGEMQVWIAEKR